MKKQKFILCLAAALFLGLVACNKDLTAPNANVTSVSNIQPLGDADNDEIIEVDDEEDYVYPADPFELEERASNPLPKVTGITTENGLWSVDDSEPACPTHPYKVRSVIANNSGFTITGENLGASQGTGSVTAKYKIKGVEYSIPLTVSSWSPTSITGTTAGITDSLTTASVKFSVNCEYKKNDSAAVVLKLKSKSVKAAGLTNFGLYGTETYEIRKQRTLANKTPVLPNFNTLTTIDSSALNYTPAVGDVVQRSAGDKGVVVAVGTADSKGRIPVTVWQRNATCKGSLKKGTWKTLKGAFIAKSSETGGTWIKFAH